MSIRTSFNPMGTLGNVKLLESCLFAQAYVKTDVTGKQDEIFDFDVSYAGGIPTTEIVDIFGYIDTSGVRRFLRKEGSEIGKFRAFAGNSSSVAVFFYVNSNDITGRFSYEGGQLTAEINGRVQKTPCLSVDEVSKINIGLRSTDPGRFRFRNLKVTQNGALTGDFVPCLVDEEICILNKVTRKILHATGGKLSL